MIDKIEVGNKISLIRNKLNYSQQTFAEMLDVTPQAVSKWESGHSLPGIETLLRISWMSRLSINTILDGTDYCNDIYGVDRGLLHMSDLLVCPMCRHKLKLNFHNKNELYYECGNKHRFNVIDGVVFFNTREIKGELWSLYFKNYEQYLIEHEPLSVNPNFARGIPAEKVLAEQIKKLKPRIILDIASGRGKCIEFIISHINWPCTIIMTDLSHRILKYDRKYFAEKYANPYVDFVQLACDCANLPLPDNYIDVVTSLGGFESLQDKFMQGFREGCRILKKSGSLVYTKSMAAGDENTEKWIAAMKNDDVLSDFKMEYDQCTITFDEWEQTCRKTGYVKNDSIKLYGELPAPTDNHFPFENEIIQWMEDYVIVSEK